MAGVAPFTLCRITRAERTYFYALFRDPETGKRGSKKSVEALRQALGSHEQHPIRRRDEAIRICQQALEAGIVGNNKKKDLLYFRSYVENFFSWEQSEYVQRRLALDPGSLSKDYFTTRKSLLVNHVLPKIHTDLLLSKVTLSLLEDLQIQLVMEKRLSNATINVCIRAVVTALREAQRKGLISSALVLKLNMLRDNHTPRGILSEEELTRFIAWAQTHCEKHVYLACLLSLLTGMRSGELRALSKVNIKDDMIIIDHAYADCAGLKPPKGKKTRYVPCPSFLCTELKELASRNPYQSEISLVFWSKRGGAYVSSHYFSTKFTQALKQSNILKEEEILSRNISFHSLRHMANTLLRGSVDEHILRMTIGHSSEQLSDLYTHLSNRALKSVALAQSNNIIPLLGLDLTEKPIFEHVQKEQRETDDGEA